MNRETSFTSSFLRFDSVDVDPAPIRKNPVHRKEAL